MSASIKVKICGITRLEDGLAAAELGADLLGLNFYPPSPRYLEIEAARALSDALRAELGAECPPLIGVFVNANAQEMAHVIEAARLDAAQLSGDEPVETLAVLDGRGFKAIRPRNPAEAVTLAQSYLVHAPTDERLPALLIDAYHKQLYGGTGEQASIAVARAARQLTPRLMLAGGLKPENIAGRVAAIQPWGVDVASGVESAPAIKDRDKMMQFIRAART